MEANSVPLRRWTRRSFSAALALPLAYVGYHVAAQNHWIIVTRGQRALDAGTEPVRKKGGSQFSLLAVGDTGKDTFRRATVVAAMRRHAKTSFPDAAVLLGDNFYENGVDSVDDPRFEPDFESLFNGRSFDFPFYAVLGNHDCKGDPEAQVRYTNRSSRWKMPARQYKARHTAGERTVDMFVIDTNPIVARGEIVEQQIEWLERELSASDADWRVVVGHHPAITGGQHETSPEIVKFLPPLFERYNVDLYLSGHDHDLQFYAGDDRLFTHHLHAKSTLSSPITLDHRRGPYHSVA